MKNDKLWFSYTLLPYDLHEKVFFKPEEFEWVSKIEDNFSIIQNEVLQFVQNNSLSPYFNKGLTNKGNSWKTDGILHWGIFDKKYYVQLAETWNVVKDLPGIVSLSVSLLKPQTVIKEHRGDTNAIIRIHLPIKIPEGIPACSFTVNNETRAWNEGKVLLFNDAQLHSAQNMSNENRILLIIDLIRPEFLNQRNSICAQVLNALKWQSDTQRNPAIRKTPMSLLKVRWSVIKLVLKGLLYWNKFAVWP